MLKSTVLPMLIAALSFGTVSAGVARAGELRMTVEAPHFTCEGHGRLLSRVAYVPGLSAGASVQGGLAAPSGAGEAPLPCCDGRIGCAQFLSTNTVVRPSRALHG